MIIKLLIYSYVVVNFCKNYILFFIYKKNNLTTMAKAKQTSNERSFLSKPKVKRAGVHAKTKTSKIKKAKNYKKVYRGQGR
jgi:hypothetical protein